MKAEAAETPEGELAPFVVQAGRLQLEQVVLSEVVEGLDGHAARLISRAALDAALASGPFTTSLAALEDLECLRLAAAAGWWCRVHSRHELQLASGAGFDVERLVISGALVDDGFLMEALLAGVASHTLDDADAANLARIAGLLELELSSPATPPRDAPRTTFDRLGGFLVGVLRGPPELGLDMPSPLEVGASASWRAFALETEEERASAAALGLRFLASGALEADAGEVLADVGLQRGDWVALPSAAAVRRARVDAVHEPLLGVLVSERSWRILPARPLPPREDD